MRPFITVSAEVPRGGLVANAVPPGHTRHCARERLRQVGPILLTAAASGSARRGLTQRCGRSRRVLHPPMIVRSSGPPLERSSS